MTISSTDRKAGPYNGNGVTTAFPFEFKVFADTEVVVVSTAPGGAETILTLTTHYTVSLNANQNADPGGTVNMLVAPATGYLLTLTSDVQNLQPVDLTNAGGFYPSVTNSALDRATIQIQQLAEQMSRAVKTNISSDATPDQLLDEIDASVALASGFATSASGSASAASSSATAADGFATDSEAAAIAAAASAASVGFTVADLQTQAKTAFTTAGSAGTLTVTTSPVYGALAAGQRMRIKFSQASTGTDTLNRDATGAKSIKQYDSTGAKIAAVFAANQLADVEYDGVDMVVLDQLPASQSNPPVRQTVLSGPVDSNGFAAFGGATGGTTVTASGTLKASAAAGGDANRTGSIANPSWTGLSTNGAMYLYLDIAADGTVTTGSTTLAPTYRWGGADVTTNNQHTFNIQEMLMKVGNGSVATQVYRVFVGEVTVAGGVVTAITWYALMGRYLSTPQAVAANNLISVNHNIGSDILNSSCWFNVTTAVGRYAVGDQIHSWSNGPDSNAGYIYTGTIPDTNRKTASIHLSNNAIYIGPASGAAATLTLTSVNFQIIVVRGW